MRINIYIAGVIFLAGCSQQLGYAGKNPGGLICIGKGTLNGQGAAVAVAGLGGNEMNGFAVTADCGAGLGLIQGTPDEIQKFIQANPAIKLGQ